MNKAKRIFLFLALMVLLISGHILVSKRVHHLRANLPAETQRAEALRIDPTFLEIVSGDFKGLVADYLLLKASVFLGGTWSTTPEDWDAIYALFRQSIQLDPYFFQTGYYTQGLLAWRKGLHEKAIEIIKKQATYRDWDWEPKFYLGFDYAYFLKDYDKGVHYLQQASKLPKAPTITATLAARLAQRTGRSLTAIAMLKSMIEQMDDEQAKASLTKRLKAHIGVYQLEQARDRYKKRFGHLPPSLDALVDQGMISRLPENTMADQFYYDPGTGEIFFDNVR